MRDYGKIYTRFWTDPDIQSLSDTAKLLACYLLSGPHTTALGAFRLPSGYVSTDMGKGFETLAEPFTELLRIGFATRCERTQWVFVHRFLKWNQPENPNQIKSVRKLFGEVPKDVVFFENLKELIEGLGTNPPNPSERVKKPFRNQEQEQEQKQDQKQEKRVGAAAPAATAIPDWLPASAWLTYVDHRKAIRKPMTDRAVELAIAKLGTLRNEGHDPSKVIDLCVMSGWTNLIAKPETKYDRPQLAIVGGTLTGRSAI